MNVRESHVAACAFSAAIEIAKEFFDHRDGRASYVVPDHTDRARYHDALRLSWHEHPLFAPESFEGYLTVRPVHGRVELIVEGDSFESASASELLDDLVTFVEREWSQFVETTPSIDACNARQAANERHATSV